MKIAAIQNDEGSTLTDEQDVCNEFLKFYSEFFGKANSDCSGGSENFFHSLHLATITSEMQLSFLAEVTAEEVYSTLKSMSHNKSPGPDGYTVKFFLLLGK